MTRLRAHPDPVPRPGAARVALVVACGGGRATRRRSPRSTVIQNKGSDTMVNVAQVWAEEYGKVDAGRSRSRSRAAAPAWASPPSSRVPSTSPTPAATSSRPSRSRPRRTRASKPEDFIVGYDALAVYVHKDNPLSEVTLEQLTEIFAEGGKVARWSELGVKIPGAADDTIVRVSRQSSSGTYEFFREHVLGNRDFRLGSRDLNGSKEVVELVGSTPTAIGYSGMGYATNAVKMLKVAPKAGAPAVSPTVAAVHDKSYPLARSLHVYTLGTPQGALKQYIDWILSDAGQKVVEASGYVPVPPDQRATP